MYKILIDFLKYNLYHYIYYLESHSYSKKVVSTYENDGKSEPKYVMLGEEKETDNGKIIKVKRKYLI